MARFVKWGDGMEQIRTMPPSGRKLSAVSVGGAVVSAFLASLCCIGPLLFAVLGVGGAGALARFEAYRPVLTVATFALLAAGFWFAYRRPKVVEGDACGCERPKANRFGRVALWVAAVLAVGFWAFPYVSSLFF